MGRLKFWARPYRIEEIVHERLDHRVSYEDAMAYIESVGGRPITKEELRNKIRENGGPLYPEEIQWTPIWVDWETKEPDWIQIGEGEGDAGTSWLERVGESPIREEIDAENDQYGAHNWNATVVYWKTTFWGNGLDNPELTQT